MVQHIGHAQRERPDCPVAAQIDGESREPDNRYGPQMLRRLHRAESPIYFDASMARALAEGDYTDMEELLQPALANSEYYYSNF